MTGDLWSQREECRKKPNIAATGRLLMPPSHPLFQSGNVCVYIRYRYSKKKRRKKKNPTQKTVQ